MKSIVPVALGAHSYDIHVGAGVLAEAPTLLATLSRGPLRVVTDAHVAKLHSDAIAALDAAPIVLEPGEGAKSFAGLENLIRALLRRDIGRDGLIVAFGGGVIGDLTGLAAGMLKRGVAFVQVPTTLLAQVDSSIGGKTAINVPEGKNLVGLFHQPQLVIADTTLLTTLPQRELLAGYAEVVKYGALGDLEFFAWLEAHGAEALAGDDAALSHAVAQSCRMKAAIVSRDPLETGERALLNLGHTFGHALEAAVGFSGRLLHGEGVAIGMALAFALSVRLGLCPRADEERLVAHLKAVGLPSAIGDIAGWRPDAMTLLAHMRHDKKARAGRIAFVLVRGLGQAFVANDVEEDKVLEVLA
ncbi:MAG: 3-dehydroquinate synthase [Alphaproteobacteria bacterium]|nr:3-dehydroquinate synthase [Alphaproteobacteria bacterium]MBV9692253.1 3-dehydroquinate synthase [Alphaproteobacteria bacterium]